MATKNITVGSKVNVKVSVYEPGHKVSYEYKVCTVTEVLPKGSGHRKSTQYRCVDGKGYNREEVVRNLTLIG